ncbi:MAG: LuxR C-terminal-related transcriptional regulator [Cupriavidus necator]
MLTPATDSRTVPPPMPCCVVGRPSLDAQLLDARHRRCFVLQGPTGCGKSTAVLAWAQALGPLGFDVAWFTLSRGDNDLMRFLDGLLTTLSQVNPAITQEAMLLAGRERDPDAFEHLVVTLVRCIADHRRELLLVLDDLHDLSDSRAIAVLQWMLDYAPPNLHLVFASRSAVPLSLARLRAQAMALELDLRDLRFSAEESEELLQGLVGSISPKDARSLHELADGWVLGLQLLAAEWNARKTPDGATPSMDGFKRVHVQDADAFSDFFEREVLSRLSHAEMDFLTSTSICDRFTASLSAALVGRPEAVGEVVSLLTHLERDSLFVISQHGVGHETWYYLHPLLRQALLRRLTQRSESEQRRVHACAWKWFRDHDHFEEAVGHAVTAGESAAAADLVERVAYRLRGQGDIRTLIRLVRQLPAEEIKSRIGLRLWEIRLQIYARDLEGATASIGKLQVEYPGRQNPERFATALVRASLAVQRDQADEVLPMLPEMLDGPHQTDADSIASRNNLLTWLYIQQGDYARARQVQLDAPKLVVDGMPLMGGAGGSLQGRCLAGLSYALEGQMAQAERVYRDVLHEAEHYGGPCSGPGFLAAALLGEVLYEINDTRGALELLEGRVDVLERISIPDSVLRVMIVLSRAHWIAQRDLEAFAYLERLEDYASRLGLGRLLAHSVAEQVHRHLQRGDFEAARSGLERLEGMPEAQVKIVCGQPGEVVVASTLARIDWCMTHGDLGKAAMQIEALAVMCEARNDRRTIVLLLMRWAVVDWRLGDSAAAMRRVQEALRMGHRLELVRTLLDADPAVLEMLDQVTKGMALDPVLSFYLDRLRAAEEAVRTVGISPRPTATMAAPGTAACRFEMLSEREVDVVRYLAQALPNKKIARNLGVSPETVKWHFKNIFSKLNVTSRDEALARLRDLGWSEEGDPM